MKLSDFNVNALDWGVNTENFDYLNLKDLFEKYGANNRIQLLGVYVNPHTKYGEQPVAIISGHYVNLPRHLLNVVKAIREDPETVEQIKSGRAAFTVYAYEDTKNGSGIQYSIRFEDVE